MRGFSWLRCWTCTPSRARQVATVSVAQMSGLLQLDLNRAALSSCTALAPRAGIGLDGGLGLGCRASERASKAVELLRRAPGLPVALSPSLTAIHPALGCCPPSNFYSLGPPVNSNPAYPHLLPRLDSVISLFLFSSLPKVTYSNASPDKLQYSASHFSSTSPFVLSTHQWDGPCSQFSDRLNQF